MIGTANLSQQNHEYHEYPKLLIVGNFLSASGGSRGVCEDLALKLRDVGWSVLTTSNKPGRLHRLLDMIITAFMHRQQYNVAQLDVYSGPSFIWAEVVSLLLRRLGKQYILILRGGNLPRFARRRSGRVRRLLASAAVVTVPSAYLLDQMRDYRTDLFLLPNPLDLSTYSFRVRSRPGPSLVWVRAFHEIYNPLMGLKVVALLTNEFSETHLTMVGPDKGDGSLQRTQAVASQLGIERNISAPGGVSKAEVPTWLERGDIFLNTTSVDNTPVSVMEAMACGLCVVSTNVDGIPYLLEHEHNALLVPPDDAEAMASAVRRILTEPRLAERLSRNARQNVEQFDWSIVLPKWESLLHQVSQEIKSSHVS